MNKRQAKKKELNNKILDIRNDYREQDKKLDALNMVNDKIFNEFKKMMAQFEKQEKSLRIHILEYGLVGMIIIFIAMLLFEVILWYL